MEDNLRLLQNLFILCLVMFSSCMYFPLCWGDAHRILHVGGSEEGNYSNIQQAIENASDGDVIFVHSGIYFEHLVVDKSISIIGENRSTTIIDGNNSGRKPCIQILAPNVLICNLTIRWADWEYHQPGVEIVAPNVSLISNNISINDKAITLSLASRNCAISNNTFYLNHYAIYGASYGGNFNRLINNLFKLNDYGIFLRGGSKFLLKGNKFVCNSWQGVILENCNNGTIEENGFINNGEGLILRSCNGNLIFHNNFIKNRQNAMDNGKNHWDNGKEGNYWSDYKGSDVDGDGIGEEPYRIPGGSNVDRFPFVLEDGWIPFLVRIKGSYMGFVNSTICFHAELNGGKEPFVWYWEFGDGKSSNQEEPCHIYKSVGTYRVNLTVLDGRGVIASNSTYVHVLPEDKEPPVLRLLRPKDAIYFYDREIFPLRDLTIAIGKLSIVVDAYDRETWINYVKISVDGSPVANMSKAPYIYIWKESCFGWHTITVEAFDAGNNVARFSKDVFRIG